MIFSQEAQLRECYHNSIEPFWSQHMRLGQFVGVGNVAIQYAYVIRPQAKGSIVISSGRIEGLVKYKELVFDLYQQGYSVFIHDHRGQGQSDRMTINPHKGYVEDFADYVADMKTFYQHVVAPNSVQPPFLLCHSMGSAIGALYALSYPHDFSKVAFVSPMFGIPLPMPSCIVKLVVRGLYGLNRLLSREPWYMLGQKNYDPLSFRQNPLTQSEIRYQLFRQEYDSQPENKLGGVTVPWLKAAIAAMDKIEKKAAGLPIAALHLQAGADSIVDNVRQDRVTARFPQCKKVQLQGAFHELLMEKDVIRNRCLTLILDFFRDE